jgi:hypothetical protein
LPEGVSLRIARPYGFEHLGHSDDASPRSCKPLAPPTGTTYGGTTYGRQQLARRAGAGLERSRHIIAHNEHCSCWTHYRAS